MSAALLLTPQWLDALLQGQVDGVLRSRPTKKRGQIYLALTKTGLVSATATLIQSCPVEQRHLEHPISVEALQEKPLSEPHWWRLEAIEAVQPPWTLPKVARRGCGEWVPGQRWEQAQPQIATQRRALRPWAKRIPKPKGRAGSSIVLPSLQPASRRRAPTSRKRKRCSQDEALEGEVEEVPVSAESLVPCLDRGQVQPAWRKLLEGRTFVRRQKLRGMYLFHEPLTSAEPLRPQPGLSAEWEGKLAPR